MDKENSSRRQSSRMRSGTVGPGVVTSPTTDHCRECRRSSGSLRGTRPSPTVPFSVYFSRPPCHVGVPAGLSGRVCGLRTSLRNRCTFVLRQCRQGRRHLTTCKSKLECRVIIWTFYVYFVMEISYSSFELSVKVIIFHLDIFVNVY